MDELQNILAEVLVVVKDGAAWSAAMAKQEIPLVVEEYLRWAMVKGACALVGALVLLWAIRSLAQRFAHAPDDDIVVVYGFGTAVTILGFAVYMVELAAPSIMGGLQAVVAPRIYLLEQLSALVK